MKLISLGVLCLTLALPLQAALVSYNGYTLDTDTKIVTGGGFEWLQWTETINMSVLDDFSSLAGGGWRVASNADMAGLYSDFFPSVSWGADENTAQANNINTVYGDGVDQSLIFGDLFGWTNTNNDVFVPTNQIRLDYDGLHITNALFGEDTDNDAQINQAFVISEYLFLSNPQSGVLLEPHVPAWRIGSVWSLPV